jgi:hypothetical protein
MDCCPPPHQSPLPGVGPIINRLQTHLIWAVFSVCFLFFGFHNQPFFFGVIFLLKSVNIGCAFFFASELVLVGIN